MKICVLVVGAVALVALPASANWSENFDQYTLGTNLDGQGGWAGWDGGAMTAVISEDHAMYAGDYHAKLFANDDAVQEFDGYTTGQWTFSGMQYLTEDLTGVTYFILMNNYNVGGDKGWGAQIEMDLDANLVTDYDTGTGDVPIVYDQWVEVLVEIDLDTNTRTTYYNGAPLGTRYWYNDSDPTHMQAIAALDLWADLGGNPVYYDNLALVPEPASVLLLVCAVGLIRRR